MMELSHSLTLNEEALRQLTPAKRPVFIFEWLRFLDKVLVAAHKSDIRECQPKLVEQLTGLISENPGPSTRKLLARCLATLYNVGDPVMLFNTINKCNEVLKNKDDSPSYLPTRLAAIVCIGSMYEKLGRMMGRSYEETAQILLKSLRNAESQARCQTMSTLEKIIAGMGGAAVNIHKDIFKAARHCLTDRVMAVRCAAAKCVLEMIKYSQFLYTTELESLASLCFRSFDGSNYDVRCAVSELLGVLIATTQTSTQAGKNKQMSLDEVLGILMTGFLRGGFGFLKSSAGASIKGGGAVSREVRVGVTHSYVIFVHTMGGLWLERNISTFLNHVLDLASNPKAATSHVDAVYSRKCINFILRAILGKMLAEKAQIAACKEIAQIILKYVNSSDFHYEGSKDGNVDVTYSQHALVCGLHELGCLIGTLGTTAHSVIADSSSVISDAIQSVLIHPSLAARLAAAWCLRCVAVADPSQMTPLIDRCLGRLDKLKSSPEAIAGYSAAAAALLGGVRLCPLGIPHSRGKGVFNVAEDLLRTASQNSRLSIQRTQAGWLLIGAATTIGSSVVRGLLPRMLLLWRNTFPRSTKELESEKSRGDAFTWQVTLEGRAGALASMHSFLEHCGELVTKGVTRRLLAPLEAAQVMLSNISGLVRSYGPHLKASAAMVRLRLYETLSLLPPNSFEGSFTNLLRLLVAEFTLTENAANTTTSMLRSMCHSDDRVILGSWLQETDHKYIEDQMEPNRRLDREHLQPNSASGSGALEHNATTLYRNLQDEFVPGPLPLGVAVIDSSVLLFGRIFPHVAHKHRLQMLEHFSECVRQAKSSRQEAIQINILTALLSVLKALSDVKCGFGQDVNVRQATINLIMGALTNPNPILRCAAGEALGRMAQVVGDGRFVAEMAQTSFDRLKSARDVVSRTGHSLSLGCLHRYVGGMGSGQHLNTSVSILLALAQDTSSPVVQAWSLHALALIADSGGPMFRGYVEPTLSLALQLLLTVSPSNVDVLQCIGRCLSALITTVGPELQGNTSSISMTRSSFLVACTIMQDHGDSLVQAEATSCMQQLHMFAPRHVNLTSLVPNLCKMLSSPHLVLRRAAASCLRQLAQREAREVCEHALTLAREGANGGTSMTESTGLPGLLFTMLDVETDARLVSDVHDTLISMLQSLAEHNLRQWLSLCKDVLTATESCSNDNKQAMDNDAAELDDGDEEHFKACREPETHPTISPRWPTRVFAAESICKIIAACEFNKTHFDLSLSREMLAASGKGDFLVLFLSDLIRMAFMAATSDSDQLRMAGLTALELIITKFASVPEPEFPGHVILEQYQAQVGAALRPAFSPETPSHVTAMACQVCSAWIGSGVARDLNDLRRVHQLLVSSLTKLTAKGSSSCVYNEGANTLEKLAIMKAWAEVYVEAMKNERKADGNSRPTTEVRGGGKESLLGLVSPELVQLSKHWLAALKDHALLSLPPEFSSQLPPDGGSFYSNDAIESARRYYRSSWAPMLHAASLWLSDTGFEGSVIDKSNGGSDDINRNRFFLIFGICIETLCSPRSTESVDVVVTCLRTLGTLLDCGWSRSILAAELQLCVELCNVMHRVLLTREQADMQLLVMDVVKKVLKARQELLGGEKKKKTKDLIPANRDSSSIQPELSVLGEGGDGGKIEAGASVAYALLEVCLCILIRLLPNVGGPSVAKNGPVMSLDRKAQPLFLSDESQKLICSVLAILTDVPNLCSARGSVEVLPTVLYLTTGVLRETAIKRATAASGTWVAATPPVGVVLQSLRTLVSSPFTRNPICRSQWIKLLRSSLCKILNFTKTGLEDEPKMDEVTMIIAVTIFILSSPPEVVLVHNVQFPCINLLKQALESQSELVQLKCIQTLKSIFQHPERAVAVPYIHALGPRVVENLCKPAARLPTSDLALSIVIESISSVDILVELSERDRKGDMLGLLVPILINLLVDGNILSCSSKYVRMLHDYALNHLVKTGPKYPLEFRAIMSRSADLRARLENAVHDSKQPSKATSHGAGLHHRLPQVESEPSIKLKTDFSNFKG